LQKDSLKLRAEIEDLRDQTEEEVDTLREKLEEELREKVRKMKAEIVSQRDRDEEKL